jgi:hypothetical protein
MRPPRTGKLAARTRRPPQRTLTSPIDSLSRLRKHPGMTTGEQRPEDDTALLTAALDHTWAWYDGWTSRSYQVANYYFLASAILGAAYTSAINAKNYGLAAAIAVGQTGLTALASLAWFHQANAAASAEPALTELQGRMADRLSMYSMHIARPQPGKLQLRTIVASGFGLSALLSVGGLLYAVFL